MRMQKKLTSGAMVVLVLSCADFSHAQDAASAGPTLFGLKGTIDFGARLTSADGDEARCRPAKPHGKPARRRRADSDTSPTDANEKGRRTMALRPFFGRFIQEVAGRCPEPDSAR